MSRATRRGLGTMLVVAIVVSGCATPGMSSRARFCKAVGSVGGAAAAGAAVGGAAGPAVSSSGGNNAPAKRMAVGAAIGAAGGAALHILLCNRDPEPAAAPVQPRAPEAAAPAPTVTRRIVLRGVHFAFDRATIKPEAEAVLAQAAMILKKNSEVRIRVAGYTDSTGGDAYNQALSERRASAVKGWLVSHGIPARRLEAVGYGKAMPVADNATEEGRAQNRRVELTVLQ